ncbi:LuxR C-terminal-related transcriptional regulator [Streptomyces sp. NPDC001276]|uniref:LuxR C-terminal-related transcriptional regulator n=1 Tax=Streptomyces sp. NPDC001276 TaxID=3364555 RepID=UPI0036960981
MPQPLINREIGKKLHMAEKTVENRVSRLLTELRVQRRVQTAILASRLDQHESDPHDAHHAKGHTPHGPMTAAEVRRW